jgi:hypothetical protein
MFNKRKPKKSEVKQDDVYHYQVEKFHDVREKRRKLFNKVSLFVYLLIASAVVTGTSMGLLMRPAIPVKSVPFNELDLRSEGDDMKFAGIKDDISLSSSYNHILVPKGVTIFGLNDVVGNQQLFNLTKYPNITSISFEKDSQCKRISPQLTTSSQLIYIKSFDTSNICDSFTIGQSAFAGTSLTKLESFTFTSNFSTLGTAYGTAGSNLFGGCKTIKKIIFKQHEESHIPANFLANVIDGGVGADTNNLTSLEEITIDSNMQEINNNFLTGSPVLEKINLFGNAPAFNDDNDHRA